MKKAIIIIIVLCYITALKAQQRSIERIERMPKFPQPYLMRQWKQTAIDYDNFIFNTTKEGLHLPLSRVSQEEGLNYPDVGHVFVDTYVGQKNHLNVSEAINVMPAIVGASLVGVNKSNHLQENWVKRVKNYFNLKNNQRVYLNNFSSSTGNDWWYEVMPNLFFIQLYTLYPNIDADFGSQLTMLADRQLEVVKGLGGKDYPWTAPTMNYRAYNLLTGKPNTTSVPEPEAAGSIAWILYQTYLKTQEVKYLKGAELAMDFLQGWTKNPSYEIQLPYGIAAAARMNATEGTNYDLQKFLDWTFSSGRGTLRGWGTIVGKWGEYDVSGLIGEANDKGNDYAFSMNGFQHAAALVPVVKYDKRYARAIAKWVLNLANASRLFYPDVLPQDHQQPASAEWSKQYDTQACIPFESLKQTWNGKVPFAMGDAVKGGWASTDLSLYSGSSVGYLAALLAETNVEGILQIDLNVTDFNGNNQYPQYLYYNPTEIEQTVNIEVGAVPVDLYDAVTETVILSNVTGSTSFTIPSDKARLLVMYPTDAVIETSGRIRKVTGGAVVDYHYGYQYDSPVRIKSLSSDKTAVESGTSVQVYGLLENATESKLIEWLVNGTKVEGVTALEWSWTAPQPSGVYSITMQVTDNATTVISPPLDITVVPEGMKTPVIRSIEPKDIKVYALGSKLNMTADVDLFQSTVLWNVSGGTLTDEQTLTPNWTLPYLSGIYDITLTLTNSLATVTQTLQLLVKDSTDEGKGTEPLIYYPFDGNTDNKVSSSYHAKGVDITKADDKRGMSGMAYRLPSSSSYIYTEHHQDLNFTEAVAISLWIAPDVLPNYEQFLISHGSWEERYKLSVTPEKKVRWTLKTTDNVVDVDDPTPLTVGTFVHYTAQYTGHSLELYRNGVLVGYKPLTGKINTTQKALTIGRKEPLESNYAFSGIVDEVRLYNKALPVKLIANLPSMFELSTGITQQPTSDIRIYPNPFSQSFVIQSTAMFDNAEVSIFNTQGTVVWQQKNITATTQITPVGLKSGLYFLQISSPTLKTTTAMLYKQ